MRRLHFGLVPVLLAVALAACAQSLATSDVAPEPVAAAPSQEPAAAVPVATPSAPAPATPPARRVTAAARAASPPPLPAEPAPILTPQEINGECWMQVENNRAARDIDARLKLVEKCIAEKTKAQQGRLATPAQ
jgi:hypothetical protein